MSLTALWAKKAQRFCWPRSRSASTAERPHSYQFIKTGKIIPRNPRVCAMGMGWTGGNSRYTQASPNRGFQGDVGSKIGHGAGAIPGGSDAGAGGVVHRPVDYRAVVRGDWGRHLADMGRGRRDAAVLGEIRGDGVSAPGRC